MYSDRIVITNDGHNGIGTTTLMLTTDALYHLPAAKTNNIKKCHRRKSWNTISWCILLNPEEMCIDDIVYGTDPENMTSILLALHEADVEVLFQREEDADAFREEAEQTEKEESQELATFTDANSNSSTGSAYSEIHGTDHGQETQDELNMYNTSSGGMLRGNGMRPSFDEQELADNYIDLHESDNESTISTIDLCALRENTPSAKKDSDTKGPSSSKRKFKYSSRYEQDFTLLSLIARGRFGKICTVQKKGDETIYAMKILKKSQIIQCGQESRIQAERQVLMRYMIHINYIFTDKKWKCNLISIYD